jgi:hypothetical protein
MKGRLLRIVSIAAVVALVLSTTASPLRPSPVRADDGTSISGRLVGTAGHLGSIPVNVCAADGTWCSYSYTWTGADGSFSATGLPPASYYLEFYAGPMYQMGWFVGPGLTNERTDATAVDTTGGSVDLHDIELATAFTISGTMIGSEGGLSNASVFACWVEGGTHEVTIASPRGFNYCQEWWSPDASSNFTLSGLSNITYALYFRLPSPYVSGFYTGSELVPDPAAALRLSITDSDITLPPLALQTGVSITGTLSGAAGNLGGMYVTACLVAFLNCDAYTQTDANGHFAIRGVYPENYRLTVYDMSDTYLGGDYSDGGLVPNGTVAAFTVGVDGLDVGTIPLQAASTIEGTLVGQAPFDGIGVVACSVVPVTYGRCKSAWPDQSGRFLVRGLTPGSYTLEVSRSWDGPIFDGYYSDSGALVSDISGAATMTVPPSVTGLTIALPSLYAPRAPMFPWATAGDGSATVTWSSPMDDGGSPIEYYTVAASDHTSTCVTTSTSCVVSGLQNGTDYGFSVTATNAIGTSAPSWTNDVTPGQVIPMPQWITFNPIAGAVYGAAPIALSATASSGLPVSYTSEGACTVSGGTLMVSGTGNCSVTATQAGNMTWVAAAPVSQSFTIAAAPLTVQAPSVARAYGSANPAFTPTYSGFVNGDTAASLTAQPVCTSSATASSPVGTAPITCSGAIDPNYTIAYNAGTLTITAVPLTVNAPSVARAYGTANPAFTPTYSGFVNGDTPASLTTQPVCTSAATSSSPVGTSPITCSGALDPNYTIAYNPGTLTIAIADRFVTPMNTPLTVTAPGILALTTAPGATVVVATSPAGKLTLGSGGAFSYVPKKNFSGADKFTYRLRDGSTLSAPVTVTIYVVGPSVNCAGCNLSGLSMSGANLSGARLSQANLAGVRLDHATLDGANLSSAVLSNATLSGAHLKGANLSKAILTNADLTGANLSGANVGGVTWSNTVCPDGTNSGANHGTCVGHLKP